jgi:hypothetical protein
MEEIKQETDTWIRSGIYAFLANSETRDDYIDIIIQGLIDWYNEENTINNYRTGVNLEPGTSLKLATTTRSDFKRIEFNKDSKKTFPVTKIIQRGDEVFDLCTQVYGFCNAQVLALVKSNNPHIRNINVIYPNLKIIFPDLGQIKQIDRK